MAWNSAYSQSSASESETGGAYFVCPIFRATKTGASLAACLLVTEELEQGPSGVLKHTLRFLSSNHTPKCSAEPYVPFCISLQIPLPGE